MTSTENSPCSGKMPSLDNPTVKLAAEIAVNNIYSLKMNDSNGNQTKPHFGRDDFGSSAFVYGQNRNLVSCEEVAIQTEADQFGLCERGAHLLFEGVVWHETQDGVLVVNITWRGKNYVGTLLDHSKYDWHPGANSCSEPEEKRATKGRSTNNSNSASMSSFPTSKRTSNAGLGNLSCPPVTSSSTTSSTSGGGRTTNNSIAAEYDATNSKLRVHAVSPLVSNAVQNTVKTESPATTVVPAQQQTPTGPKSRRGAQQQNSASKSPPPLTIVEDQQQATSQNEVQSTTQGANFSAPAGATPLPATGVKRKSEKNPGNEGMTPSENKTGKKPRVTITNYGANNETTLTTIIAAPLANGPPADVYWKCSEENCSKKYKHKNGLRYHITHAHGKSEAEADLIIEQEMSAHIAAMGATVTTEMVQNSNPDDESAESSSATANGKVVSPTGKGGKKGGGSRKNSSAKEKKKPRRESEESPPGSEQGLSNASEADINSSLTNVVNNTKLSAVPEISAGALSIGNPKVSLPEQKISPVMASNSSPGSGSKSKLQRMANLPLQGTDPANQPERKVAKVAPTTFSGNDAMKQKHHSQDSESGLKLDSIIGPGGNVNSNNNISRTSHQQTSQNFPIQTPMYPFGAVDPKLYTNFVGQQPFPGGQDASNVVGTSHDMNVNNPNSPKPEGTAARIVHASQQQRISGQAPSGHSAVGMQQSSQQRGSHPNSGFIQMQHRGAISNSSNSMVNWHNSDNAGGPMSVDSNMAKFVEVNAQHIAESAADSLMTPSVQTSTSASSSQIQIQPPVSQQQQQTSQQMQQTSHVPPTPSAPPTPIASHHVHNHIHNYVGFPPHQMMQHQQQQQMVNNQGQNPNQGPLPQNNHQGPSQKLPQKQPMHNSNVSMSQHSSHLHAQSSSINSMPPIGGPQVSMAGINPTIQNHSVVGANPASTILPGQPGASQPSPSQSQFASLIQGRPLAPISPFNPRGSTQ